VVGEEFPVRLHQDQRRRHFAPVQPDLILNFWSQSVKLIPRAALSCNMTRATPLAQKHCHLHTAWTCLSRFRY